MAIFNSYVSLPEGTHGWWTPPFSTPRFNANARPFNSSTCCSVEILTAIDPDGSTIVHWMISGDPIDFGNLHIIYIHTTYIYAYTQNMNIHIYMIQRVITIIVSLIIIIELINYRFTSHLRLVSNDFEGLVIARSHFLSYQPTILFHPCSLAVGCRNPYLTVDFIPIFCWSKTINTNSCGLNPCFFPS